MVLFLAKVHAVSKNYWTEMKDATKSGLGQAYRNDAKTEIAEEEELLEASSWIAFS